MHVLFIHGILGKPDFFDFLRPCIPSEGFHTEDILLEGHCDSPRAFGNASMARWRGQVSEAVESIRSSGSRTLIVAHSMGTLFAIDNAVKGKVDALFLLNPPLSIRLTCRMPVTSFKVMTGKTDDPLSVAAKEAYSISVDKNPLHYLGWIPRYIELFAEIFRTRPLARRLAVHSRVYLSEHDELVSPKSARWFPSRDNISVDILHESSHYFYADTDRKRIISDFSHFLNNL